MLHLLILTCFYLGLLCFFPFLLFYTGSIYSTAEEQAAQQNGGVHHAQPHNVPQPATGAAGDRQSQLLTQDAIQEYAASLNTAANGGGATPFGGRDRQNSMMGGRSTKFQSHKFEDVMSGKVQDVEDDMDFDFD